MIRYLIGPLFCGAALTVTLTSKSVTVRSGVCSGGTGVGGAASNNAIDQDKHSHRYRVNDNKNLLT